MLAVGTSAIRNGDAPRSPISHAEPTLCIKVPMFEAKLGDEQGLEHRISQRSPR